jgi:IS30 family transposase
MQLQPNERDKIAIWSGSGISAREIGRRLGRDHTVINRELKRNRYGDGYVAIHAQNLANKRNHQIKKKCWWQKQWLYSHVIKKLREGWSPEQISGRLKLDYGYKIISHESIYRFIYDPENKDKKLWEYLTRKQRKRYKKYGRKTQRTRIPNRVSIHTRGKRIDNRKQFGHWESDSIIGQQTKSKVIHTEVERKTRYLSAVIINSKSATDTIDAQKKIFTRLPAKTVTMDNGTEFVKHEELNKMNIKTFFADPYCSGQRGTNENTNGLIRRYLPKKTNFKNLTQEDLDDIVWEINNRPRKVLQFSTPFEALQKSLLIIGGAFRM